MNPIDSNSSFTFISIDKLVPLIFLISLGVMYQRVVVRNDGTSLFIHDNDDDNLERYHRQTEDSHYSWKQ